MCLAIMFCEAKERLESEHGHPFSRTGRVSRVEKLFRATARKSVLDQALLAHNW